MLAVRAVPRQCRAVARQSRTVPRQCRAVPGQCKKSRCMQVVDRAKPSTHYRGYEKPRHHSMQYMCSRVFAA